MVYRDIVNVTITQPKTVRSWIFPKHRFFEWESKDEAFCRKYGMGYEKVEKEFQNIQFNALYNDIKFTPIENGQIKCDIKFTAVSQLTRET